MSQISLFDGGNQFKITKPIRMIQLFAGYGSQSFALDYLGVKYEDWKICEWAVKSIQAYKDAHFPDDNFDYSAGGSFDEVVDVLFRKGISMDYNKPMTREQIKRMGEKRCRTVYNNIWATHNLVSVCNTHAEDLQIKDTDKYEYIMTYSFPCQDLSKAGLGKGMAKDSGTRSGMLWEVERILDECEELPQVLVMENVPDVIGTKNIKHFAKWLEKLESLGYKCYWKCLNSKNYGVPQNRDRCFMVSVLGDYYFEFPTAFPLKKRLKDVLEKNVDEKWYLKNETINYFVNRTKECKEKGNGFAFKPSDGSNIGRAVTTRAGSRMDDNFVIDEDNPAECNVLGNLSGGKWDHIFEQSRRVYGSDGISPTIHTAGGGNQEIKIIDFYNHTEKNAETCGTLSQGGSTTSCGSFGIREENLRIRKLTPKECFRLMGVHDEDFERIAKNQSASSLFHLAGDSIVVDVLMNIFRKMR